MKYGDCTKPAKAHRKIANILIAINFIEEDLMDVNFESLFKKDTVLFHEAGQPGVRASWGQQFETYVKDNILVTQRILESAKKMNNLKILVVQPKYKFI